MPRYSTAMRSYSPSTSGVTSELGIVWSSSGGHTHDGVESSIIDGEAYSMFDFRPASRTSTIERDNIQTRNRLALRQFIADTIRQDYNIILDPDTIGAANIIGDSITANLLATNAITSRNYVYTSGDYSTAGTFLDLSTGLFRSQNFAITSDGSGKFKGTLEAAGGSLASFKITSEALLTDGFVSATVTETEGTYGTQGGTGDGGTYTATGAIRIFNYGDIEIQSKPTSGPYNGLFTVTELSGEYLNIQHTTDGDFDTWEPYYNFIGTLGSDGYTDNEFKLVSRSNTYSSGSLSNNNGSYTWVDRYQGSSSRFLHGYLQSYGTTVDFAMDNRPNYGDGSVTGYYGVYMRANTSASIIALNDGTFDSQTTRVLLSTASNGSITVGGPVSANSVSASSMTATGTVQAEHFYSTDDAQIGDSAEYVYINSDDNNQIQLTSNTTTGRPYLSFYNYNSSDVLTRKAYIGYPTARSSGGTGLVIASDVGDVYINPSTVLTVTSTVSASNGTLSRITPCTPTRYLDTRSGSAVNGNYNVTVSGTVGGVSSSGATGAFINITALGNNNSGYISIGTYGGTTDPGSSVGNWDTRTLNVSGGTGTYNPNSVPTSGVYIKLDSSGRFRFWTSASSHVLLEITGFTF